MEYPFSIFNENTTFQKSKLIRQIHDLKEEKNKIIWDKKFLCGGPVGCFFRSILLSFIFILPIKFFTDFNPILTFILFMTTLFLFLSLISKILNTRISVLDKIQRNCHGKISHLLKKAHYKRLFHRSNFLRKEMPHIYFNEQLKKSFISHNLTLK